MSAKNKKATKLQCDMNRVGLFQEMGYLSSLPDNKKKKRGFKTKGADQAGYFAERFLRLSEGDPYKDRMLDFHVKENAKSFLKGPFHNAGLIRMENGKGNFYVTINPCPEAMSPETRPQKSSEFKNGLLINPGKKGTGYGYLDVTINKYIPSAETSTDYGELNKLSQQENVSKRLAGNFHFHLAPEVFHVSAMDRSVRKQKPLSSYKPFPHPTRFKYLSFPKKDGGMKAGTLNPFPYYDAGVYSNPLSATTPLKDVRNNKHILYKPSNRVSFDRAWAHPSVITTNLKKALNSGNCRHIGSVIGFKTCPC